MRRKIRKCSVKEEKKRRCFKNRKLLVDFLKSTERPNKFSCDLAVWVALISLTRVTFLERESQNPDWSK